MYYKFFAFPTGCQDFGACWQTGFGINNFTSVCEELWQQVKPLYQQLHAYVRRKLIDSCSNNTKDFPSTRQIPAHILGESSHVEGESIRLTVELGYLTQSYAQ